MTGVPRSVAGALRKVRQELAGSSGRIYLKCINGKFYVYRDFGTWDPERKRPRTRSEYLGRVLPDGTFARKLASYADELDKAKALIAEKGGEIIWHGPEERRLPETAEVGMDEMDRRLLTALSMNARASFASIGKLVGLSPAATYSRVKGLEKRYGIRYMAEIDVDKLGYLTYLILIKFEKEVPSLERLREAVGKDRRIQLAFATKGEHDLMIFMLAEATAEGTFSLYRERETIFPESNARWYRAPIYVRYNFIPMRDEFFEILKERVWKRSKESPRPLPGSLTESEYLVMRELCANGAMDFAEIDRKHGFDRGRAQYAYRKLRERGIIKRVTISLTALPLSNLAVVYVENVNDRSWEEAKRKFLSYMIKETDRPINQYAFAGDTGIPNGTIFVLPMFSAADLENAERELAVIKDARITVSLVVGVIAGGVCFRRFDNMHSTQYSRLVNDFGVKDRPKVRYD